MLVGENVGVDHNIQVSDKKQHFHQDADVLVRSNQPYMLVNTRDTWFCFILWCVVLGRLQSSKSNGSTGKAKFSC